MKLNIVRAWKDEVYRQSLTNEEMDTLPANPVGELELADASLQSVYGTGGGGFAPVAAAPSRPTVVRQVGGVGVASGSSGAFAGHESFHSLAFSCRETLFSLTAVHGGFNFLSPVNAFCINDD